MTGGLAGRTALVTGAASGIGRGVAIRFAEAGAHVVVADLDAEGARAVARDIVAGGGHAASAGVDVAREDSVDALRDRALDVLGRIDVLVHAPGVGALSPVVELSRREWDRVLAVDLTGPFLVTRAVLPDMIERRSGRVVIFGSQLAFCGAPGMAHYCAAKAGVHGFVKAVAREVAPFGVTVNAVAPGPTDTPLLRTLPDEAVEGIRAEVPVGRIADVDEIVPTAMLLASEAGGYYTGAVLSPCGGHVMP